MRKPVSEDDVYIGRPSKWGNPFSLRKFSRNEAICNYEKYLKNSKTFEQISELDGKKLFCHCAPLPCHGDILIKNSKNLVIRISQINELE